MSEPDDTIRLLGGFPRPDRTAAAVLVDDMFDVLERMLAAQRRFAHAILTPGEGPAVATIPSGEAGEGRRVGSGAAAGRSAPEADVDTDGDTLAGEPRDDGDDVVADADEATGDGGTTDTDAEDTGSEDTDDVEVTDTEVTDADDEAEATEDLDGDAEDADASDGSEQVEDADAEDGWDAEAPDADDTDETDPATTTSAVDEQVGTSQASADQEAASTDRATRRPAPEPARRARQGRSGGEPTATTTRRRPEGQRPRRSTSDVIRTDDESAARASTDRPARRRSG